MDKELKTPFQPPKNKTLTDKEVEKMIALNKNIVDEIKVISYYKRFWIKVDRPIKRGMQNLLALKTKFMTLIGIRTFKILW